MSGTPTSRSTRSAPTERGIAYGTRVLWRRSLHSSPRTGEPSTRRRETGGLTTKTSRYARCETPTRFWESQRPLESCGEIERLMPSSERGRRKSAARQLAGGLLYGLSGSGRGGWCPSPEGLAAYFINMALFVAREISALVPFLQALAANNGYWQGERRVAREGLARAGSGSRSCQPVCLGVRTNGKLTVQLPPGASASRLGVPELLIRREYYWTTGPTSTRWSRPQGRW